MAIPLIAGDRTYRDTEQHAFIPEKGMVVISAGASSADLKLKTEITVK